MERKEREDDKYRNQIFLDEFNLEKNKEFMRALFIQRFSGVKRGCSLRARGSWEPVSITEYLSILPEDIHSRLQIGSPDLDTIHHGTKYDHKGIIGESFFDLAYTPENLAVITEIFYSSFKLRMEEIPILPGVREYTSRLKKLYGR